MPIFCSFIHFFITEWIWSFTFGWHHALFNMLILMMLLVYIAKLRMLHSLLLSFCSQVFAIALFTLLARFIFDYFCNVRFSPDDPTTIIHPLATSFLLGVIYTSMQSLFFYIISFWLTLPLSKMNLAALLSNTVAALLVYKYMPTI